MDAIQYSKAGARVYLYGFDFDAAPERFAHRTEYGLSHAGELIYTFGSFRQNQAYRRNWDESPMYQGTGCCGFGMSGQGNVGV